MYSNVPSSVIRNSLFGIVMLWATDFFPLWKKVSGVQILLAIKLFNRRTVIGPLNFNLSSFQLWRKNTSIVYSYQFRKKGKHLWCHMLHYENLKNMFLPFPRSKMTINEISHYQNVYLVYYLQCTWSWLLNSYNIITVFNRINIGKYFKSAHELDIIKWKQNNLFPTWTVIWSCRWVASMHGTGNLCLK